jgi:hypothetical protein
MVVPIPIANQDWAAPPFSFWDNGQLWAIDRNVPGAHYSDCINLTTKQYGVCGASAVVPNQILAITPEPSHEGFVLVLMLAVGWLILKRWRKQGTRSASAQL